MGTLLFMRNKDMMTQNLAEIKKTIIIVDTSPHSLEYFIVILWDVALVPRILIPFPLLFFNEDTLVCVRVSVYEYV